MTRLSPMQIALLLLFVLCGFWTNLGNAPLFDLDEGAFSEATREMLRSGIWSATYLDGLPRFDKPILTYWFQALSVQLFGLNEFALRLHSVISASLWGLAIFIFCRQFMNKNTALAAIMVFSSMLMITVIGRAATADALLNLFICLTFFEIYRFQQTENKTHIYRCWLWLSLGLLTKGPVAVAIPFVASGIWLLSLRQLHIWLKLIFNPVGMVMMIGLVTPWLFLVWQQQGSDFFTGFLLEHNLQRFAKTRESHGGYWYYYLLVLPLVMLPYSGMLVKLVAAAKKLWSRPLERLLIIWFVLVFILVSVSQTQLPHYVLYGMTPLVILVAKYRRLFNPQYWQWLFPVAFFFIQIALVIYAEQIATSSDNQYIRDMLSVMPEQFNQQYLLTSSAFLASLIYVIFLVKKALWKKLVFAGLLQSLFLYFVFVPAFANIQQAPVKAAAEFAKQLNEPIVAYKISMPSFSVYRDAITERRDVRFGDTVFTRSDRLEKLTNQFGNDSLNILFSQQGIVVLQIKQQGDQ